MSSSLKQSSKLSEYSSESSDRPSKAENAFLCGDINIKNAFLSWLCPSYSIFKTSKRAEYPAGKTIAFIHGFIFVTWYAVIAALAICIDIDFKEHQRKNDIHPTLDSPEQHIVYTREIRPEDGERPEWWNDKHECLYITWFVLWALNGFILTFFVYTLGQHLKMQSMLSLSMLCSLCCCMWPFSCWCFGLDAAARSVKKLNKWKRGSISVNSENSENGSVVICVGEAVSAVSAVRVGNSIGSISDSRKSGGFYGTTMSGSENFLKEAMRI